MRNSYKIVLVSILVIILACTLFACTGGKTPRPYEPAPSIPGAPEGDDGDNVSPDLVVGSPAYLSALVKEEYKSLSPSSNTKGNILPINYAGREDLKDRVFKFEMIEIQVIGKFGKNLYRPLRFKLPDSDGTILEKTDLKEAWVNGGKADLGDPGKHTIEFSTSLLVEVKENDFKETELKGSVEIYLGKYMNDITTKAIFQIPEGYISNSLQIKHDANNDQYFAQMMVGENITYADFVSNYRIKLDANATGKEEQAIDYWKVYENKTELNSPSTNFGKDDLEITIKKDTSYVFEPVFVKNNTTTVKFDNLDKVAGVTIEEANQLVVKGTGLVPRPTKITFPKNLELTGWYYKYNSEDILWNFNDPIGSRDELTLFPKFKAKTFSLTMYLRGAAFDSKKATNKSDNRSAQAYSSFQKYSPFGMNILKIDGLESGTKVDKDGNESPITYADYKINTFISYQSVEKNENGVITYDKIYESKEFDLSSLKDMLQKPENAQEFYGVPKLYIVSNGEKVEWDVNSPITGDVVVNAEWPLKDATEFDAALYDQYVFKNNVTVKADGTLRLDKIEDYYIETLRIPATYVIPGSEKKDPYEVTEIGPLICQNFTGLTKLDLTTATNLTTIGERAFANCVSLSAEGIIIDKKPGTKYNITTIEKEAFEGTDYLNKAETNVVLNGILIKYNGPINNGVVKISSADNIKTISSATFANNLDITGVVLEGVENIYSGAFANCKNLASVTITGAKYIAPDAFDGTAFYDLASKNHKDILFDGDKYLYRVNTQNDTYSVPAKVETIGEGAFLNLISLKNIEFNNHAMNITNVMKDAFKGTKFVVTEKSYNNKTYVLNGFVVINNILCAYTGNETAVSIPKGITEIAPYAFSGYNNENVSDILCPPSIRKIGAYAFADAFSKPYSNRGDARILFYQKGYKENPTAEEKDIDIHPTAFATDYIEYIDKNQEKGAGDKVQLAEGQTPDNKVELIPVYRKGAMPSFLKFCYLTNVLYNMDDGKISAAFTGDTTSFIGKLYNKEPNRFAPLKLKGLAFNEKIIQNNYLLTGPVAPENIIKDIIKPNLQKNRVLVKENQNEIFDGIIENYVLTNVTVDNTGNSPVVKVTDAEVEGMNLKTGLMLKQSLATLEYFKDLGVEDPKKQDKLKYTLGGVVSAVMDITIERTIKGADSNPKDGISVIDATKPDAAIKIVTSEGSPFFIENGKYKIYEGKSFDNLKIEFTYSTDENPTIWPKEGKFPSNLIKGGNTSLDALGNKKKLIIEYKINELLTYRIELDYQVVAKEFNKKIELNPNYRNTAIIRDTSSVLNGEEAIKLPINSAINKVDTDAFRIVLNDGSTITPPTFNSAEFKISKIEHYIDDHGHNIITDLQNPVLTELGSGKVTAVYTYKGKTLDVVFNFVVVMAPQYNVFEYEFDKESQTATIIKIGKYHQGTMMVPGSVSANDLNTDLDYYKPEDWNDQNDYSDYRFPIVGIKVPNINISSNKEVVEIGLPNSITEISADVFKDWTNLKRIGTYDKQEIELFKEDFLEGSTKAENKFPSSLITIGDAAFSGTSLKEITFANGSVLSTIGVGVFAKTSIQVLDLSACSQLTKINTQAFADCIELLNVTLPNKTGTLATQAFYNCYKLKNVDNVGKWTLNPGAFTNCRCLKPVGDPKGYVNCLDVNLLDIEGTILKGFNPEKGANLDYLTIPDGIVTIADNAFAGFNKLQYVYIPESVTTIGIGAFSGCASLTTINIPVGVTEIKENTFKDCKNLAIITLPASATTIGNGAFNSCESLVIVNIPDSVTSVDPMAFEGTAWFKNKPDGVAYAGKVAYTFKGDKTKVTEIIIEEGIHTILAPAVSGCTALTTLSIPTSITTIDAGAFDEYKGITTLTLPVNAIASITDKSKLVTVNIVGKGEIPENAFNNCGTIVTLTISEGITTIGAGAFDGCSALTTLTLPVNAIASITDKSKLVTVNIVGEGEIPVDAFKNCGTIVTLTISEGITTIGAGAFDGCTALTTLTLPVNAIASITDKSKLVTVNIVGKGEIPVNAFKNCTKLVTLTISEGITTIGSGAFEGCSALTTVNIPQGITEIKENTFKGCAALKVINIPERVTTIGVSAFNGCTALIEVTLPESVTTIGASAFNGCTALTTVNIPVGVTEIKENTFNGCTNLSIIEMLEGLTTIGASAFNGCIALTEVTLPESVTTIGANAFNGCTALTTVTIPESVTTIGANAFDGCTGITTVTLPVNAIASITDKSQLVTVNIVGKGVIPADAFKNCTKLVTLTISEGITEIGTNAFNGCTKLVNVTIPDSVVSVDPTAFVGTKWFEDQADGSVVYAGKVAYLVKGTKASFIDVTIKAGTHTIAANLFSGCTALTTVIIPESVTIIGAGAFNGCSVLTTVNIPAGVTEIKENTFKGCAALETITIPDSVVSVDPTAFEGTAWFESKVDGSVVYAGKVAYIVKGNKDLLTTVEITAGTHTIAANLFSGCTALTTVIIPESVTTIGAGAFDGCSVLTTVNIPAGVTEIKENTFKGCAALETITIPDSVETIGANAFKDCVGLTTVTYEGTAPKSIHETAFAGCTKYNK